MLETDYVMRTIQDMARAIAKILFGKDTYAYDFEDFENHTDTDLMYLMLDRMIREGKINQAENILLEKFDPANEKYREMAVDFYGKLNEFGDEFLEANGYSRIEIGDGLKYVSGNMPV